MIWINCAEMRPRRAVPRGRRQRGAWVMGWHLRRLNGPQIKQERTRVLAREAKRRHVRMTNRQPFAQPLHERIKIDSAIERAKGRGANVRALTALADRMALLAHSFRQSAAALLERSGAAVFGETSRRCEEHKEDSEPQDHFGSIPLATKKSAASLIRLRALWRWSEADGGFAIETRKRVELRILFVRLAAHHCNPTERAMPNRRSRLSGHWARA